MATRTVLLTLANLLIPVAILVFATGFFPYKPFMPGLAQYEELGWNHVLGKDWQKLPEAPFDKVVFVVVDALRSDFVFGEESGMGFVQRYILSKGRDGAFKSVEADNHQASFETAPPSHLQPTLPLRPSPCPA